MPKLTMKYFREQGGKGGKITKKKHGKNYFSEIAKKRWADEKKKKAASDDVV